MPRKYEEIDWYQQAEYYDIVFDTGTEDESRFLAAVDEQYGRPWPARGKKRALEPACGTGRLLLAMAERGYDVTGIDLSSGSLEYARQRFARSHLSVDLQQRDMVDFHLQKKFDLAWCLVSSLKLLLNEQQARSHLQSVAGALSVGGLYVLGVHLTDYDDARVTRERWTASRDGVDVVCNIQAWPACRRSRTERVRARLKVSSNGGAEHRYQTHWTFRTYSENQLKSLLRSVPQFAHIATYAFNYDMADPVALDGETIDTVLVLRRQ